MAVKRKKPRSALKNVVIVLAVFLPVLALVLYARMRDRTTVLIFPEERVARDAQRSSPDNGFPLLIEAAKLAPTRPSPIRDRNADTGDNPWQEPGERNEAPATLAALCLVGLADDDAQLLKLIDDAAPAAAKAHEALEKPILLYPVARRFRDHDENEDAILYLGRLMVALGRRQFEKDPKPESLTPMLDAVRMVRRLCQGEALTTWAELIERAAWQQVRVMGTKPGTVLAMLQAMDSVGPGYQPRRDVFKAMLLHIDDQLARQESAQDLRPPVRMFRGAFLYELQRIAVILKEHLPELMPMADDDPGAMDAWLYKNAKAERGPDDGFGLLRRIHGSLSRAANLTQDYVATRTGLAIVAYHEETGTYPPTLDALMPKYLAALPIDPILGAPVMYKHTDSPDGYVLYAFGKDGKDDGGDPKADEILARSTPPVAPGA